MPRGSPWAWPLLWLALAGCSPDPESRIAGTWVVDVERWLAGPHPTRLHAAVRAPVEDIARAQVAALRFDFSDGECRRTVAGRSVTVPCRVHTVDRDTVVLRATRADGVVDWIRVTPDGPQSRITWGGRPLPVRRLDATAGAHSP